MPSTGISLQSLHWKKLLFLTKEETSTITEIVSDESTLAITAINGSITLKPSTSSVLTVHATKKAIEEELPLTTVEKKKEGSQITLTTVTSSTSDPATVHYTVYVPKEITKIVISSHHGPLLIDEVPADLSLIIEQGNITIIGATKNVQARTTRGSIYLDQKTFPANNTLFLETIRGPIELVISKKIQAYLQARTLRGTLTCDIPVTLEPRTTVLTPKAWQRIQREARGQFGFNPAIGSRITIDTARGTIRISGK